MATAKFEKDIKVDIKKLFQVIIRYEDYPKFVDGCTEVRVESRKPPKTRVFYKVSKMKEIEYTLEHEELESEGVIRWTLVSSNAFKKNSGRWTLKDLGGGKVHVDYEVDIDFSIPVPGFVLKKLIAGSLPDMVQGFVDYANRK